MHSINATYTCTVHTYVLVYSIFTVPGSANKYIYLFTKLKHCATQCWIHSSYLLKKSQICSLQKSAIHNYCIMCRVSIFGFTAWWCTDTIHMMFNDDCLFLISLPRSVHTHKIHAMMFTPCTGARCLLQWWQSLGGCEYAQRDHSSLPPLPLRWGHHSAHTRLREGRQQNVSIPYQRRNRTHYTSCLFQYCWWWYHCSAI